MHKRELHGKFTTGFSVTVTRQKYELYFFILEDFSISLALESQITHEDYIKNGSGKTVLYKHG